MKLIGHINAAAAWRESPEEYGPEAGAVQSDLIQLVKGTYAFEISPQPSVPEVTSAPLIFHGGKFLDGPEIIAVGTLIMDANGDVAQTVKTDQADGFLADLHKQLDEKLGFRLRESEVKKSYLSNVVVEFEGGIEARIKTLSRITEAVRASLPDKERFGFKRISFGAPVTQGAGSQIESIERADFVIDRRVGVPFEQNRFFCTAPMRTEDHLRLLAEIEAIIGED